MKILSNTAENAVVEFTKEELGLLGLTGTEFTQGQFAPSDKEWEDLMPRSREYVIQLFEQLP